MSTTTAPIIAGKYHLLRKLGAGGMAEVFLARQSGLDGFEKLVVIKRILPHISQDEEFVTMFLDEARTAADLRHPNVVNIFEVGEAQRTYFMAMEFLHGQDIRRIQRKSASKKEAIPLQHACQVVIDAANGLHYAHTKQDLKGRPLQIIHRDVSPQNIIVSYDGSTKILDFGIAKAASQDAHTATGVIKGKYTYMSPEQAQGESIDHRSDQFALGIVFWELLTMRRLFKRPSEIATLNAIIDCHVPSPRTFVPDLPEHLEHIVMQCLARDPADRFDTCEDVVLELEDFLAGEGLVHSSARVGQWMRGLFAEELSEEADLGTGQLDGESFSMASLPGGQPTTGGKRSGTKVERSRSRSRSHSHHEPMDVPDDARGEPDAKTAFSRSQSARREPVAVQVDDEARDATRPGDGLLLTEEQASHHDLSDFSEEGTATSTPRTNASHAAAALGLAVDEPEERRPALLVASVTAAVVLVGGALLGLSLWFGAAAELGQLTVRSVPAGASIVLDGEDTGFKTPHIFIDLEAAATHELRLELADHHAEVASFTFGDPPVKELELSLERAPAPKAVVSGAVVGDAKPLQREPDEAKPAPAPAASKRKAPERDWDEEVAKEAAVKKAAARQQRRAAAVKPKPARLRIVAKPWAFVFLNGKKIGETPIKPRRLPPGTYEVRLVNPELGKDEKRTVRLGSGDDELIRVEW